MARTRQVIDQQGEIPIDPALDRLRDPKVERLFNDLGVTTFTLLPDLRISQIDVERGWKNQARIGPPLVSEQKEKYRIDRKNGANFPAIVVVPIGGGRGSAKGKTHYPIDGNHRLDAYIDNGDTTIPAYEVRAEQATLSLLTMTLNVLNGLPPDRATRMMHAEAALNRGMSIQQASRFFSLPQSTLAQLGKRRDDNDRAAAAGINLDEWLTLPTTARDLLARVHTDEGFVALYDLYRRTGMGKEDLADAVAQMNGTRAATKQREVAQRLQEVHAGGAAQVAFKGLPGLGKSTRSTATTRIFMTFGNLTSLAAADPEFGFLRAIDDKTRTELRGHLARVQATIATIEQRLSEGADEEADA